MLVWWNWQTRWTQNPLLATVCGFNSHHQHQAEQGFIVGGGQTRNPDTLCQKSGNSDCVRQRYTLLGPL